MADAGIDDRAARQEGLQGVLYDLAAALTIHELSQALVSIAKPLGASATVVYLVDRDGTLARQASGGVAPWAKRYRTGPPGVQTALATDVRLFRETRADIERRDPAMADAEAALHAEAILPLHHDGRRLGVFAIGFETAHRFDDEERHWLTRIAVNAAVAANRVRLVDDLLQTVRLNELFVGAVAHDLRQPLHAITLSAAVLDALDRKRRTRDPRGKSARKRIAESAARMSGMIGQLVDFTRLHTSAELPLAPTTSELAPLVVKLADEFRRDRAGVAVTVALAGDTRGTWDADRLGQMLSNLIGAAVAHSPDGAGVRVEMDGTDPASVCLRVHDVGTIPADQLPTLFEPLAAYARGRNRTGLDLGLGPSLGLYISKEIVAAHGGELTVSSSEPEGTTFTVSLPRSCTANRRPRVLVRPATQPPTFSLPTLRARLDAVKRQLKLRRMEMAGLRLDARRTREHTALLQDKYPADGAGGQPRRAPSLPTSTARRRSAADHPLRARPAGVTATRSPGRNGE